MGWALLLLLCGFLGAHLALLGGLARRGLWWSVVLAVALPPFAPWSGWQCRMRARSIAWAATLALYALGVVIVRA